MERTSKDLLQLEHKNSSTTPLESTLTVCKKDLASQTQKPLRNGNPINAPLPKSEVLGKVKDFLGVISEANERLQDNSEKYDIEVLTGNESEIIEMDLMLGIADLHTPEAIAAAESAIAGCQPVPLAAGSSGTDSEDSSDDSDDDEDDDNSDDDAEEKRSQLKLKRSESGQNISSSKNVSRSEKRPKIIVLS